MSSKRKLATVKAKKADVSSVSPSSERSIALTKGSAVVLRTFNSQNHLGSSISLVPGYKSTLRL